MLCFLVTNSQSWDTNIIIMHGHKCNVSLKLMLLPARRTEYLVDILILHILCSLLNDDRDYVSDTIGIHSQSSPPRLEDTPHSYKWVPHQSHFLPRYIMCLHSDYARTRDSVTIIQEKVYNYRHFKSAKQRRHKTGNFLKGFRLIQMLRHEANKYH